MALAMYYSDATQQHTKCFWSATALRASCICQSLTVVPLGMPNGISHESHLMQGHRLRTAMNIENFNLR
jgi:hypothetical protein